MAKDITQYQQVVGDTKMSPSRAWGKICVPKQELGNEKKTDNRKPKTIFILQAAQVRGDVAWALSTMNLVPNPCLETTLLARLLLGKGYHAVSAGCG
ncbi:MAG: hypothetical protein ABSA09_04685 [Desulfobaccales bacterium]